MKTQNLVDQIKAARRVSTPLVAIATPDPAATIETISSAINGGAVKIAWDIVSGMQGVGGEASTSVVAGLVGEVDSTVGSPMSAMTLASKMPEKSVLFMHMASRWMVDPAVIQAIWILRDKFKVNQRMLILLAPSIELPPELAGDVVVFDEPLPGPDALREIILAQYKCADLPHQLDAVDRAVEAVQGLPAFQAEQVTAMSLTRDGLDLDALWERKRRQIELTPGLKVHRGEETFSAIGGVPVIKDFLRRILVGKEKPSAIVFVDEIEKMLAGSKGDTSGVSQDQLGALLSYMQDQQAAGMILIGPPGAAKSMVAKAAGNEAGIPTIQLDAGGLKGSLVGQSEHQLRNALKVITSVSNGRSLWIATCNSISDLPPELRRRFTLGTFFFDLPSAEERKAIWDIYMRRFKGKSRLPNDAGWTGAEIRQCCDIAWRLDVSLDDAAAFVVPVSRSAAGQIEALRKSAHGRFLSASYPGVFDANRGDAPPSTSTRRKIED